MGASSLSPCDFIPELMSFVSLDLYIRWEQSRAAATLRSFYLVLFISCLYLNASLCILCTHKQYILTDLTLNVLCLLDFSRLHVQVFCLVTLRCHCSGFWGLFWFVCFFKMNEKFVF